MLRKEQLIQNKPYWVYHIGLTKKRNRICDNSGIFKVIPTIKNEQQYTWKGEQGTIVNWEFLVIEGEHSRFIEVIKTRLYSLYNFYETEEEAIKAHDDQIKQYAQNLNTRERDNMFNKLIIKDKPTQSKLEIDSINWYNSLPNDGKEYVKWIKHYYSKI